VPGLLQIRDTRSSAGAAGKVRVTSRRLRWQAAIGEAALIRPRPQAGTVMLIGEKICLGPLVQSDGPLLFNWLNNLEIGHANGAYRPSDQTKFDQWFSGVGADPSRVVFAIRQFGDLRLMGYIQIINIQAVSRVAEMGVLIGDPRDRGQGFAQEAVALAVAFCWRDLNLQRLSMFVIGHNPPAVSAYRKAGFEVEGVMRRTAYVDGGFRDITIMGLLRDESELAA
jgi:ribosomal-protein-alanine N-acetyltransferase